MDGVSLALNHRKEHTDLHNQGADTALYAASDCKQDQYHVASIKPPAALASEESFEQLFHLQFPQPSPQSSRSDDARTPRLARVVHRGRIKTTSFNLLWPKLVRGAYRFALRSDWGCDRQPDKGCITRHDRCHLQAQEKFGLSLRAWLVRSMCIRGWGARHMLHQQWPLHVACLRAREDPSAKTSMHR
jgi:hypothetical protein